MISESSESFRQYFAINQPTLKLNLDDFSSHSKDKSEYSNAISSLQSPLKRDDIKGNDDDLTPVEEYYLKELEHTVNFELIDKMRR